VVCPLALPDSRFEVSNPSLVAFLGTVVGKKKKREKERVLVFAGFKTNDSSH
jgi:hypothetical protein